MNNEEIGGLLGKTAMLMEQFQRQCDDIGQRQQQLDQKLQQTAQAVPGTIQQSARNLIQGLPEMVSAKVQSGLDQPIGAFSKQLQQAGRQVEHSAQTLAAQLQQLQRLHQHLTWKIIIIVLGALALLLAGGGWLMNQYRADIAANQIQADLLRAYNQADVVLCGQQLCANVEMRGAGVGDRQQYRPVLPRRNTRSNTAPAASP